MDNITLRNAIVKLLRKDKSIAFVVTPSDINARDNGRGLFIQYKDGTTVSAKILINKPDASEDDDAGDEDAGDEDAAS